MLSLLNLAGSRAIITGASSGIGRALAVGLAGHGVRLVLASRNAALLQTLEADIRALDGVALAVPTDITQDSQRRRLIDQALGTWGGLDILINNAGVGAMGFFAHAGEERLRRIFEINFFGTTELTRLAIPHLRQGRHPMIVNVGSVIGRRGIPGCTEYCASKFALSGWIEGLRAELVADGIHVLLASPGLIESGFRANLLEDHLEFTRPRGRGMTSERCAQLIIRAMRRRKNEVTITAGGRLLVWLNRLSPRLVDSIMIGYARTARPKHPTAASNG
jgi:short-subunit dehydrogenase